MTPPQKLNAISERQIPPEQILAFLGDPRSYPQHPKRIRILHTHASYVALAGQRAYKVKKPVNFGFLDFSKLEQRRYFCEREVALNRRLCPDVHLGVVPIVLKNGRLTFDGDGETVEFAIVMRRLSERHFMLCHIARGEVTRRDVDRIVETLAPFYAEQIPTREIEEWGRVTKLKISTDENFRQTQDFVGVTISRPAFEAIRIYTRAFYEQHAFLFAERIRKHRILDCHGDLHLEHIHLSPSRLSIFDCIEFNDRFRYIDVANDTAFLAMDFDFHGRADLAQHFARRMAAALRDPDMQRLLDFYKSYRAYVRGKVEGFHAVAAGVPQLDQFASRTRAETYFRLALRYAACGSEPMVLITMGRVGSGKSTLARSLGRELGWKVFSSDRVRKDLAGVPLYVRGGAKERRRLYAKKMSDKTYAALTQYALGHAREARGAILDATFSSRHRRDSLRRAFERAGVGYCFVETRAPTVTIKQRLAERARIEGEISDARLEDFPELDRGYQTPSELDRIHFFAVKTARTSEAVVVATLTTLSRRHATRP